MLFDRKTLKLWHLQSKTSVSFTFSLNSESCLLSYFVFPVCYHKRMTGGGLNIRFPYHLLYHFVFVIMLSVVKYSFTLVRIARAVFLCNNVLDIHKMEQLVKNITLFSNEQHVSFFRNHVSFPGGKSCCQHLSKIKTTKTLQYIQVRRVSD